jgi:hypothetical protein
MTYDLQFDSELRKHDKQFEVDGVKVVVDVKSYLYLNGTTLDYVTQGLTGGFTFVNPNAKSSCGCGTSFTAWAESRGPGEAYPDLRSRVSKRRDRASLEARLVFEGATGARSGG